MTDSHWETKRPEKAGYYWYYGNPFARSEKRKNEDKRLCLVRVVNARDSLTFIANGNYMDNKDGYWQKAILPDIPREEE